MPVPVFQAKFKDWFRNPSTGIQSNSSSTYQFTYTAPSQIINLGHDGETNLDLTDVDLNDSIHNATLNLNIVAYANSSGAIVELYCIGTVKDIYEFYWPAPNQPGLGSDVTAAGITLQSGYNTLGNSGQIFQSIMAIDVTYYEQNEIYAPVDPPESSAGTYKTNILPVTIPNLNQ